MPPQLQDTKQARRSPWLPTATLGAAIAAALLGGWLWWTAQPADPPPAVAIEVAPQRAPVPPVGTPADTTPLRVQLQLDMAIEHPPLPPLEQSDATLLAELLSHFDHNNLQALLQPERLIRRIVATVDNLPRADAPDKMWPVKPAEGWLITRQVPPDRLLLAPPNQRRYDAHVTLLIRLNAGQVTRLYRRYYPLFQQAYEELGYPGASFHDRLRTTIADLLATPEVEPPLALLPDNVRYRFADSDLDRRSAGQKILLRVGPTHTRSLKAWLHSFRSELARHEIPIEPAQERKQTP